VLAPEIATASKALGTIGAGALAPPHIFSSIGGGGDHAPAFKHVTDANHGRHRLFVWIANVRNPSLALFLQSRLRIRLLGLFGLSDLA
jgi:hypothetical protein